MSAMMGMMHRAEPVDTVRTRATTTPSSSCDRASFLAVNRSNMSMVFIGPLLSA